MRILDKRNSFNEVVNLIITKARYQKVVLCIDENSDMEFVDNVVNNVGSQVVLLTYYYNKNNIQAFRDMVDNGARVVIYNVSCEHFYELQNDNNYVLNMFFAQTEFILPYIVNAESVYGDNLLICDTMIKDYTSLLFMYGLALERIWGMLIQGVDVDTQMFKNLDAIANGNINFYSGILQQIQYLKLYLTTQYQDIKQDQLPYYIYLRLCSILKMLESVMRGEEQYVDFYKTELSSNAIEKAHNLLVKYNIVEVLKCNCQNLIKIDVAILNRAKIIIKKYFNFNNINLNKLNKIIKKQSQELNADNLLYISYIFNSII